ncbi:hypothetical protein PIROE2DRAFT_17817 [Piromyces sp. E2]|nr:hypothetical protein PIROE2DRAFT_17817 [Piromyces sp. E2]|eukprot:OUM57253.1 hypothetical protein PIROE2DRAFT_17817 [Piromyces sp. E2]
MNNKIRVIYIYLYILLYIQSIHSIDISVNSTYFPEGFVYTYDISKARKKKDLVPKYGSNYYCRNDNCIELRKNILHPPFIEFPDENGNLKIYIFETCGYEEPETFWYCSYNHKYNETSYRLKCYNDSDCLYNKCINHHCVYNDESPATHCDTIYKYFAMFERSYIHCGKDYEELCENNDECSSESCSGTEVKICSSYVIEPSETSMETKTIQSTLLTLAVLITISISLITFCFCKCCNYKDKKFEKIQK